MRTRTRVMAGAMVVLVTGSWMPAWGQDCIDERIGDQRDVVIDLLEVLDKQAVEAEKTVDALRRIAGRSRSSQARSTLRSAQAHLEDVLQAVDAAEQELAELDDISTFRHDISVGDVPSRRVGVDPCVQQCPPYGPPCAPRMLDEFDDFDTTIGSMTARMAGDGCGEMFPFLVTGSCSDGTQFIYEGGGFTETVQYFESDGAFRARTFVDDVPFESCGTTTYWPEHVVCSGATVGLVYCGTMFRVGEQVCLP